MRTILVLFSIPFLDPVDEHRTSIMLAGVNGRRAHGPADKQGEIE